MILLFVNFTDIRQYFTKLDDKRSKCNLCSKVIQSQKPSEMKRHYTYLHMESRNIPCSIYQKHFKNEYALKLHISTMPSA